MARTRRRNGQTEYQWPNGSWHSRAYRGGDGGGTDGAQAPAAPAAPARPPAGYYDPALDAQLRASQRGLIDLRQDTELGDARAAQDYTFGMEGYGRERARGYEDILRSRDRGYEDIDRQVMLLQRGYQQLARRQGEGNRLAGVMSPGMLAKQMQIRAANMAIEQQPLTTARTRLGEDYGRSYARIGEDYNVGTGRLGVDYARGGFDRGTALTRAEREQGEFGLDIGEQQRYQATQAGWVPPIPPRRRARGRARRVGPNTSAGIGRAY